MRRLTHILSIGLITAGIVLLIDVGVTLAYQEPLSAIYSSIKQGEKESQLKTLESEFLTQTDVKEIQKAEQSKDPKVRRKTVSANVDKLAQRLVDESKPGDALGTQHRMGWFWALATYRRRPMPEGARVHDSVKDRLAADIGYRLPTEVGEDAWADRGWTEPSALAP